MNTIECLVGAEVANQGPRSSAIGAGRVAPLNEVGSELRPSVQTRQAVTRKEGTAARPPVLLRAHHLEQMVALTWGLSPNTIATNATNDLVQSRGDLTASEAERRLSHPVDVRRDYVDYAIDVVGVNATDSESRRINYEAALTELLDVPADASIKLVVGQRDGICHASVNGRHCDPILNSKDPIYIKAFQSVAHDLGLEKELVVGTEVVVYGPHLARDTQTITVPAGVVKQVIREDAFGETVYRLIDESLNGRR